MNKWLNFGGDQDKDPDPDLYPYRDTGKTCLGGGMHCSRPTQPPTLSGAGNEYQPKCGDALRLGSKGRYGSFHLRINVWVAGKSV